MKNKIVFFLSSLNGGGAERVSINIINTLDTQEYEIHLILVDKVGELLHLIPNYVQVHNLKSSKTIYSINKLRKTINLIKADIIYSTLYRTHFALFLALLHKSNKPKIILRMPNSPKLVIKNKEISRITKILLDITLKYATRIIAQTPEMKEEIIKYHHVKENKVEVVINPIDKKLIDKSITGKKDVFKKEHINVVASGRIIHQKGYDILIQAFQKVYLSNQKYRLYIIGSNYGNYQNEYEALINRLDLNDIVIFLGFQKNPYIYYNNADLFVMSSRWEGLPNTILENLYLKKPIVATNCIAFMSTLIQEGENGLLVEPENIDMLADAILTYKKIKNLGNVSKIPFSNINKLFKEELHL